MTLPGDMPLTRTYNTTSILNDVDYLNGFITTSLENILVNQVHSILGIELPFGLSVDQTEIQCLIADLAFAEITVNVKTSGIMFHNNNNN